MTFYYLFYKFLCTIEFSILIHAIYVSGSSKNETLCTAYGNGLFLTYVLVDIYVGYEIVNKSFSVCCT
jgi:hypothetical protein